jgi:hypothetical protein
MTPYIPVVNFECNYVISNPRKFYKIPIGSFVFLKKCSDFKNNYGLNVFATLNYLLPKLIGRILLASRIGTIEKLGLKFNKYSEDNVPIKTDFLSLFLIKRFAIFDLSFERINQYNLYYELLRPLKKYFYFQKKASRNDCPFGFILKDKLNKFLNSNRVFPSFLWDVPNSLEEEIEFKTFIQSKEIMVLPIGSQYCEKDIRNICDILLKFFKS